MFDVFSFVLRLISYRIYYTNTTNIRIQTGYCISLDELCSYTQLSLVKHSLSESI